MKTVEIVEIVAIAIMALLVLGIFIERLKNRRSLGARSIQFLAVGLLIPSIVILALEQAITADATATLIGALTGYLLSGIGKFKPSRRGTTAPSETSRGAADAR